MTRLRAFLIALTILAMVVALTLVPTTIGLESTSDSRAYASVAAAPMQQDDGDNDDDDDNDDGDNDDSDDVDDGDNNDNDSDDGGDNDDDHDGDDADNDNDDSDDNDNDGDDGGVVSPPPAPPSQPASGCTTPGQEMGFQSADVRIVVTVYPTMSQSIRIQLPIGQVAVPPAPGPVVSDLSFEVIAYTCDGSLDEGRLTLARLNTGTNQWQNVAKQATDPPNNYTSATITEMGHYVLYQRP